jgi:predicted nicotinamide N-methyase
MSALNALKFVSAKRPQSAPPIVHRRNKLSNQLHEQIELAKCQADGKTYASTRLRSIKDKHTGERKMVEAIKRVKAWWFTAENGKVCLQVRYGTKVLELAKGKNSIEVGASAELVSVLETVKKCVESGELDAQIDAASAAVRERFSKG